jgi:hypothetical protein
VRFSQLQWLFGEDESGKLFKITVDLPKNVPDGKRCSLPEIAVTLNAIDRRSRQRFKEDDDSRHREL